MDNRKVYCIPTFRWQTAGQAFLLCLRRSRFIAEVGRITHGVVTVQRYTAELWNLWHPVLLFLHLNNHLLTWRSNRNSDSELSTLRVDTKVSRSDSFAKPSSTLFHFHLIDFINNSTNKQLWSGGPSRPARSSLLAQTHLEKYICS